jgi:hypothetical protein
VLTDKLVYAAGAGVPGTETAKNNKK